MNINHWILARALRFTTPKGVPYMPDVVEEVRSRYGFIVFPRQPEELLPPPESGKPVEFLHGKFERGGRVVVIRRLQLYGAAIAVDSSESTDDSDAVMEDILAHFASRLEQSSKQRVYASQLEVALDAPFERISPIGMQLCDSLTKLIAEYEDTAVPPFRVATFGAVVDPTKHELACDFRIERRTRVEFDKDVYWCQAPLRTKDHIAMLRDLESRLKAAPA